MPLRNCTLDEMIEAIDIEIDKVRRSRRAPGSEAHVHYERLKAVADSLRGRRQLPRSNALGELERAITNVIASKTSLGYSDGKMNAIAQVVIGKWHTIRQALEQYGEESSE